MSAIDLGIAMQLTNISRDVVEDLNNNRSYINENFEEIKSTLMLAEKFYENSFHSISKIPISFRFAILVARRVYRKIGYKILKKKNIENYRKSGKIYVSNLEKIIETFLSVSDLSGIFFQTAPGLFLHVGIGVSVPVRVGKRVFFGWLVAPFLLLSLSLSACCCTPFAAWVRHKTLYNLAKESLVRI